MDGERRGAFRTPGAGEGSHPLCAASADVPIAWRQGAAVTRRRFLSDVRRVSERLPDYPHVLNLCEDRYLFLAAFAAASVRRQTSLLPATRVKGAITETMAQFPQSHAVADAVIAEWITGSSSDQRELGFVPTIDADHVAAITFTSGSTGRSQPHLKRWGELVAGAWLARQRFGFALTVGTSVVATVPPQHMYGLETSVMLPLTADIAVWHARPFFPDDIAAALAAVPAPRVLVTTPAHLRVCVSAGLRWPELALVLSATAPLPPALAETAEHVFAAPLMEIYGCTEAGSIASRRTVSEPLWTPYSGMRVRNGELVAEHLPAAVPLQDIIEVAADGRFALLGRQQDLVNIAGKRTSLACLNHVLSEIEGVADGVFVLPGEAGERPARLSAFVVAPGMAKAAILAALAERIDPVFLPRPLVCVDKLPRTEAGKLRRETLLAMLAQSSPQPEPARD
jgi:acyl-coenzyme A synthetase/AMP-(fatty) acid ligase